MEKNGNIESLFEKAETYGKTSFELFKLNAIDKYSDVLSSFAVRATVISVILIFILMLSAGIAFWLGEILEKNYYGFFAVAAFYALAAIILFLFRNRWIKMPVNNSLVAQVMN